MSKYEKTIIYKLCCNDTSITDIYIASSINFDSMKFQHKQNCMDSNSSKHHFRFYQFIRDNGGWENWEMIQIELFKGEDKRDVNSRVRYWVDKLKPTLNRKIPNRTQKEYYVDNKETIIIHNRKYKKDNEEKITNQQKEYYNNNKETILIKSKEYRNNNKEKLKEMIKCECGIEIQKQSIYKHIKTKKHINKMKIEL